MFDFFLSYIPRFENFYISISTAITIGFVREMYSVGENDGFIDICIEVKNNGMLEREVSVAFSTGLPTRNAATST